MKQVWKAVIVPNAQRDGVFRISVPAKAGAKPLTVMNQCGRVCVWFEVNTDYDDEPMTLYSVGTGFGVVPNGKQYLGSVIDGNQYVWHLYF